MKRPPRIRSALAGIMLASTISPQAAEAMSAYRWTYRPVVVIAGSGSDAALAEQRRIFATARTGLSDRKVVVVWVVGSTVRAELGPPPGLTAAQLRARFGTTAEGFHIALVGKDGGTKLARSAPLGAAQLFRTIDAMPMRRDEMRRVETRSVR